MLQLLPQPVIIVTKNKRAEKRNDSAITFINKAAANLAQEPSELLTSEQLKFWDILNKKTLYERNADDMEEQPDIDYQMQTEDSLMPNAILSQYGEVARVRERRRSLQKKMVSLN